MVDIFTMECIAPTPTVEMGKRYIIKDFSENDRFVTVVNKNGNKIKLWKNRFKDLRMEKSKISEVTCINKSKFRNLTKGKTYKVEEDLKNYIIIKNDKNVTAKYSKKYFSFEEDEPKVVKKVKKDDGLNVCVIPSMTLSYNKKYKLTPVPDNKDMVTVIDDSGNKIKVLRKRFK